MRIANAHRQRLFAQTVSTTRRAMTVILKTFKFFANPVAVGLAVPAFHIRDNAFKRTADLINATPFVIPKLDLFLARPAQEHLLDLQIKLFPARVLVKPVMFGNRFNSLQKIRRFAFAPRGQGSIGNFQCNIRDNKRFVEEQLDPQTVTAWAGPKWRVKRK